MTDDEIKRMRLRCHLDRPPPRSGHWSDFFRDEEPAGATEVVATTELVAHQVDERDGIELGGAVLDRGEAAA